MKQDRQTEKKTKGKKRQKEKKDKKITEGEPFPPYIISEKQNGC